MTWVDPTNPDKLGLAVKGRSRQHYDDYANELRQGSGGVVDQNQLTRNLIDNSQNSQAMFSPWFQALSEATGSHNVKLGQDAARPHGLADDPAFYDQGDVRLQRTAGSEFGNSTSIGSPSAYRPRRTSLDVLQGTR